MNFRGKLLDWADVREGTDGFSADPFSFLNKADDSLVMVANHKLCDTQHGQSLLFSENPVTPESPQNHKAITME